MCVCLSYVCMCVELLFGSRVVIAEAHEQGSEDTNTLSSDMTALPMMNSHPPNRNLRRRRKRRERNLEGKETHEVKETKWKMG